MKLVQILKRHKITYIHCDTLEKAQKLLSKLDELEYKWFSGGDLISNSNWECYKLKTVYKICNERKVITYTRFDLTPALNVIPFNEIDDFKSNNVKYNFFEDFHNNFQKLLKECCDTKKYKNNVFWINEEKKTLVLKHKDKTIKIKCDEEDKFDWQIGLGLALSQAINSTRMKAHREFFRNKKTKLLDVKKYANWVLIDFYNNDMYDLQALKDRVKASQPFESISLD